MQCQYRPSPNAPPVGAIVIDSRFLRGLLYYAPLTDIVNPLVSGTRCSAQVYGDVRGSWTITPFQLSGTTAFRAMSDGYGMGYQIFGPGTTREYLTFGANSNTNTMVTPISGSAWCRHDATLADYGCVSSRRTSTQSTYCLINQGNGTMYNQLSVAGSMKSVNTGAGALRPSTAAVWHHFGFSYDNVKMKLYMDGRLVATTNETGAIQNPNTPHVIGHWDPSQDTAKPMLVREVAAWSGRLVTASEMALIYQNRTLRADHPLGQSIAKMPMM